MPPSPIRPIELGALSPSSSGSSVTLSASPTPPVTNATTQGLYNSSVARSLPDKLPTARKTYPLPPQSIRVALILNRFTIDGTIIYCSNDNLVSTTDVMGRPFFNFVSERNEELVRTWVDMVKGWGVNERGQPSDGGFGFGKFILCPKGRDSSDPQTDGLRSRRRTGSSTISTSRSQNSRTHSPQPGSSTHLRPHIRARGSSLSNEEIKVDAIFSAHSDGVMVILRRAL